MDAMEPVGIWSVIHCSSHVYCSHMDGEREMEITPVSGLLESLGRKTHTHPRNFFPLDFYFVEENPMITYACSIRSSALTRASVLVSEVGLLLMGATKVCEQTVVAQQNLHVV